MNHTMSELEAYLFSRDIQANGKTYRVLTDKARLDIERQTQFAFRHNDRVLMIVDGASHKNGQVDSVAGWGCLLLYTYIQTQGDITSYDAISLSISGQIPGGTNNQGELTAIKEGALALARKVKHLTIVSDSLYAIRALDGTNRIKKNSELIHETKGVVLSQCNNHRYVHINGHIDWFPHEYVDLLAKNQAGSLY